MNASTTSPRERSPEQDYQQGFYIEDASQGFHTVGRILRRRKVWVALGVIFGLAAAVAYYLLAPKEYTASAQVYITAVSAEGQGRTGNNGVDVVSERQLAASGATAQAAAEELGQGWTRDQLLDGVEVTGESGGAVLRVAYTDITAQRAQQGAMGIALAFLTERSTQARERNEAIERSIDEQIRAQQSELRSLLRASQSATQRAQAESLRANITVLQQRKFELGSVFTKAGEIITPADANPVYASPTVVKTVAMGGLGGLALGLVLALAAHVAARRPGDSVDVEELLGVPVWNAGPGVHRWDLVGTAAQRVGAEMVLVDARTSDATHATQDIIAATGAEEVRLDEDWIGAIQIASGGKRTVAVFPQRWSKKDVRRLGYDLEISGANLVAAVLTDTPLR